MKLLVLILLIACGKQGTKKVIDPAFLQDISAFERIYHMNIKSSVVFGKVDSRFVAVCNKYSDGSKKVIVDKIWWQGFSREQQQSLVFHELGHCELNLGHTEAFAGDCPVSLMYPSVFPMYLINQCFIPSRQHYLENL
jgi:hypothetical protein